MSALRARLRPWWRALKGVTRAGDWWEHKLACLLGTAYALAWWHRVPMAQLGVLLWQIIAALIACAAYVCVINDITDREEDERAGKLNWTTGRSRHFQAMALVLCAGPGLWLAWGFRHYPVTLLLYVANWLAFTLYSAPPFRLKTKGGWGVLADTCGGQFLPTLWVAMLVTEGSGHTLPWKLGLPLGLWAFALGLRGILSHQLRDAENDRVAGVPTFVVSRGVPFVSRLIAWGTFPVEVVAMLLFLGPLETPWRWFFLGLHLLAEARRARFSWSRRTWQDPHPEDWVPPAEYYKFYYPITFALALALREPWGWTLLALHFLLFRQCSRQFWRDLGALARSPWR